MVGQWIYLSATFNLGEIKDLDAFINGNEVSITQEYSNGNVMWDTPVTDDLGRYRPEVRWSKVVRTDAWIKTSYNTMNDPPSFLSFGSEESAP